MAIIDNRVTEEGDVLIIKTEYPIVGLISLTQFVDTTVNESETDYFLKEFRYSLDGGITFGDWTELTLANIQLVQITRYDAFIIEYRYTRVGNAPLVELEFNDILVSGVETTLPYPAYDKTYFKRFFNVNDINVFGWALNVLEKLYAKGSILPDFYIRGSNQSNLEDEDFLTYWNSITHLFAIIVYYARQFDNISNNEILLEEFLKSRDIIVPANSDLPTLLYLFNNYINEIEKRGTIQILDRVDLGADIDGELLRLVNYQTYEDFMFCLLQNYETGWCISKSSPTWKGTEFIKNINKSYEFTKEVVDLDKYPLVQESFISIVNGEMKISNVTAAIVSGVKDNLDITKRIVINPSVDYEISFFIRQTSGLDNISFKLGCFNVSGIQISLENVNTGDNTSTFFADKSMLVDDVTYWVRGIVYSQNQDLLIGSTTNLGIGNNLRFKSTAYSIVPEITVTGAGTQDVFISNLKVRPLRVNFSRGQLGIRPILYIMAKNNNDSLTELELNKFIEKTLIPYKLTLKSNWL